MIENNRKQSTKAITTTTTTNGVPACVCFDGDDADLQQQQLYVYTSIEALLS